MSDANAESRAALKQGFENVIRATLGENLQPECRYVEVGLVEPGLTVWSAIAKLQYIGREFTVDAMIPVRHPDVRCGSYRIDDALFEVRIDDYAAAFIFEAWCEYNPYGAATVVRQVALQTDIAVPDRWLVAHSEEEEVLYRGIWDDLMPWAKKIATKHWSERVPYACIDTEKRAMDYMRFQSRGTQ
jgi:hypothetical protein